MNLLVKNFLTREKFNILKTDKNKICNKSTFVKMSKPIDIINKRCHKKSNSINLSYLPFSINIKKEENNSFVKKNNYYQQQYLSTSESYNNYSKNNINNNNKLNNNSISTLSNMPRHNNSLRKINYIKNKGIIKSNFVKNKIPFNINNKKKYTDNENLLKKRIPINKNIIISNNNKNYRYIKMEKNVNYELTDPMTVRQKSSKQIIYKKVDKIYHNNSFKEEVKNRSKINQKYNIGNYINDIICVNSIIKNNDNYKFNKLTN